MAVQYFQKYMNGHKLQHFPFQGPPNFTKIGILGLKTNHLATLTTNRPQNLAQMHKMGF
jgi:hypothetical protein